MFATDLDQVIERYHDSVHAARNGDAEPQKQLYSRADDATLANPLGPPVRGWEAIATTLDQAVAQLRDGEPVHFERVSACTMPELAYIVEIEQGRVKLGGAAEATMSALRVTTIFRREADAWRIVHRHADPITTPRSITWLMPPS